MEMAITTIAFFLLFLLRNLVLGKYGRVKSEIVPLA